MLETLSDILSRLQLAGTLYFRTSFTSPWGVAVPAFENVARFHFAHRGECMVRISETGETVRVAQGDLVIIPRGAAHDLFCGYTTDPTVLPLDRVLEQSGFSGHGVLVHGGTDDARETQLICGHFALARFARHLIFDRLPSYIHIRDYGSVAGGWLEATLRLIAAETGAGRLGGDLVALKLSEAIFAQALRVYIENEGPDRIGLAGFADPQISRALDAFHEAPNHDWTIEKLAREAGVSRTGFAVRFSDKMGVTPMQYLTSWRMQVACRSLIEAEMSISEAAHATGYASESALTRVFKKEVGTTPAAFRAAH